MKRKKITKETLISEVLELVPNAAEILIKKYGIFCVGCPMSVVETLKQGAKTHGLTEKQLDKLILDLNRDIS